MDVMLGPWTTEKTVDKAQSGPLTEAMADEAWNIVKKSPDFTPIKAPKDKPGAKGFTISGKLANVSTSGGNTQVVAKFNIWVDGAFSNVATVEGRASATGRYGAEDALRAVTENRVKMLLQAIKAGRVAKQG